MNSIDILKEALRPEGVVGPMGQDIDKLDLNIKKILNQKYMLCATIRWAKETLEEHMDNGEHDQWIHTMIQNFEEALKRAVI